jgi:translocation and assembly module TamB
VSQLGALEAVQLANSAAQLAGIGGSAGLVDRVRRSLGVDRLGVTTTITGSSKTTGSYTGGNTIGNTSTSSSAATVAGNTSTSALEVGRYVTNDLYLGVEQGLAGDSGRAKMEVGITDNVQATAGMGIHADPDIGLKFEWNY